MASFQGVIAMPTLFLVVAGRVPRFNDTACPASWELQAPHVPEEFRPEDIEGFFYELAFHDYTQYPLCPFAPRCITSRKALSQHEDGVRFVNDTWNLTCAGRPYREQLLFNLTDRPGALRGYWPNAKVPFLPPDILAGVVFPDTVVDFRRGPRGWLLEFQCVERHSKVLFVGINFYAKVVDEAVFREMESSARSRGLGFWMDRGFGLRRVDFRDCGAAAAAELDARDEGGGPAVHGGAADEEIVV